MSLWGYFGAAALRSGGHVQAGLNPTPVLRSDVRLRARAIGWVTFGGHSGSEAPVNFTATVYVVVAGQGRSYGSIQVEWGRNERGLCHLQRHFDSSSCGVQPHCGIVHVFFVFS